MFYVQNMSSVMWFITSLDYGSKTLSHNIEVREMNSVWMCTIYWLNTKYGSFEEICVWIKKQSLPLNIEIYLANQKPIFNI